jgi:hypothetical protein
MSAIQSREATNMNFPGNTYRDNMDRMSSTLKNRV